MKEYIPDKFSYCKICKMEFKNSHGLRIHLGRMHKVEMVELETMLARNSILAQVDEYKGDSL